MGKHIVYATSMKTDNPYLYLRNLSLIQQQAGVDTETAELVCAYAKLKTDNHKPVVFHSETPDMSHYEKSACWGSFLQKNQGEDPRWLEFLIRYAKTMAGRGLPSFFNAAHLAKKWFASENQMYWMLCNIKSFYTAYEIPKDGGGVRRIDAPDGKLKTIQGRILRNILNQRRPEKQATAFLPGSSLLKNVNPHVGRAVVVRMDLKDFFPNIRFPAVRRVFQEFGYPYRVAGILASFCTLNGRLPQGAPTSPAISNFVCTKLDRRIHGLSRRMKFRYTRYADDLIFSSNNPKFTSLIPLIKEIIAEEGFIVNEKKTKIMRRQQCQIVTGVIVNEKPNLKRAQRRQLRAVAHRLALAGPEYVQMAGRRADADPLWVYAGKLAFFKHINPEQAQQMETC